MNVLTLSRRCAVPVVAVALCLTLGACESALQRSRAGEFAQPTEMLSTVRPKAMALALHLASDGHGLTPESTAQANAMLNAQGRLSQQVLTLAPYTPNGQAVAARLATALERAGAQRPHIEPVPRDGERLALAVQNGWDLELISEAMVVQTPKCGIASQDTWAIHPYYGVGTLGCANRANIARMVSDPRDLMRPRTLDGADGKVTAAAVERYQNNEIADPIDINFEEK